MPSARGQAVPIPGDVFPKQVISILWPGYLVLGTDVAGNWFRVNATFTLLGATVEMVIQNDLNNTSAIFVLQRSTNNGGSWSTIGTWTFSTGVHTDSESPTWSVDDLDEGDLLRLNCTQTDDFTGYGLSMYIIEAD